MATRTTTRTSGNSGTSNSASSNSASSNSGVLALKPGTSIAEVTERLMAHKANIAAWAVVVLISLGLMTLVAFAAGSPLTAGVCGAIFTGVMFFTGKTFVQFVARMILFGTKLQVAGRALLCLVAAIFLIGSTGMIWEWAVSVGLLFLVVDRACGYVGQIELCEIEEEIRRGDDDE